MLASLLLVLVLAATSLFAFVEAGAAEASHAAALGPTEARYTVATKQAIHVLRKAPKISWSDWGRNRTCPYPSEKR
jgi:hypothetical protein